jgi:hypothetical protein
MHGRTVYRPLRHVTNWISLQSSEFGIAGLLQFMASCNN